MCSLGMESMSGMDCKEEATVTIANAVDLVSDLYSLLYTRGFRQNATLRGENFRR